MYLLARRVRVEKKEAVVCCAEKLERKRLHYHAANKNAILPKMHTKAFCNPL